MLNIKVNIYINLFKKKYLIYLFYYIYIIYFKII